MYIFSMFSSFPAASPPPALKSTLSTAQYRILKNPLNISCTCSKLFYFFSPLRLRGPKAQTIERSQLGERERRQLISQLSQFLVVAILIVIVFVESPVSTSCQRNFALFLQQFKECKFNANGKLLDELSRDEQFFLDSRPMLSNTARVQKQATHSLRRLPSLATYASFGANKMCQKWHDQCNARHIDQAITVHMLGVCVCLWPGQLIYEMS